MFIGGIIASLGLFLCAFAQDINSVIITFGVINGKYLLNWENEYLYHVFIYITTQYQQINLRTEQFNL